MAKKIAKKKRERRYIPRETRKFQLRLDDMTDLHVREILEFAKTERREVTMIRNAIRLIWALEHDEPGVLFELFPNLKGRFVPESTTLIEQFQQMLLQHQPVIPEFPKNEQISSGSIKSLPVPKIAMPTFDDEDTIVLKRDANAEADVATNFLSAALGVQHRQND